MKKTRRQLTPQEHRLRENVLVLKDLQTLVNMELENFYEIPTTKDLLPPLKSVPETALRLIVASERYRGFLEAQEGKESL